MLVDPLNSFNDFSYSVIYKINNFIIENPRQLVMLNQTLVGLDHHQNETIIINSFSYKVITKWNSIEDDELETKEFEDHELIQFNTS